MTASRKTEDQQRLRDSRETVAGDHARPLTAVDWSWLAAWATDPVVDRELGPIDRSWLEHVLADDSGIELIIVDREQRPFALVGCVWDPSGESHVVSDIAVDPRRRSTGLGRRAIAAALGWAGHPETAGWTAFVSLDNSTALHFFRALGWQDQGQQDGMRQFFATARIPQRG